VICYPNFGFHVLTKLNLSAKYLNVSSIRWYERNSTVIYHETHFFEFLYFFFAIHDKRYITFFSKSKYINIIGINDCATIALNEDGYLYFFVFFRTKPHRNSFSPSTAWLTSYVGLNRTSDNAHKKLDTFNASDALEYIDVEIVCAAMLFEDSRLH